MKQYKIKLRGCDDVTKFHMLLNDKEYELIKKIAKKSVDTSEYSCMPILEIKDKGD